MKMENWLPIETIDQTQREYVLAAHETAKTPEIICPRHAPLSQYTHWMPLPPHPRHMSEGE